MDKPVKKPTGSPKERIVDVASDLFYQQGFRATGINEVIEKSGVAKATFYNHFPSKDDLGLAYLEGVVAKELGGLDEVLARAQTPREQFLAVLQWIKPWLDDTKFRGCAFLHAVAEVPDPKSPLRRQGKRLYDGVRQRMEKVSKALVASDAKKYGHLDPDELTDSFMLVFTGTIAMSEIYHEAWPVKDGVRLLQRLIGETDG